MVPRQLRVIELVVAVSVVVISIASLFVAVFQGIVMQRSLEASVMPIISYGHGNYDQEREEQRLRFAIDNRGLGPADIRWVRFHYDGQQYRNLEDVILECCLDPALETDAARQAVWAELVNTRRLFVTTSPTTRQMLTPNDILVLMRVLYPEEDGPAREIWQAINQARWRTDVEICYCSVFDKCWRTRFPENQRESVRRCTIPPDTANR